LQTAYTEGVVERGELVIESTPTQVEAYAPIPSIDIQITPSKEEAIIIAEPIVDQTIVAPAEKPIIPQDAPSIGSISSSAELIPEILEIPAPEESYSPGRALTPIVPKRDLRRILISKGLLHIEIPASAFASPRFPSSPTMLASPHIPSAPYSTPVSTPDVTPVTTPTNAPSTPKLHMTRPKLPTRDELKARSSTLKRTSGPTLRRIASESIATPAPDSSSCNSPTDINELYARFGFSSSDVESDTPESPHSPHSPHRLLVSVSEERIYSPESSDSEDSFLQMKDKYATVKIEPDALSRYEQDIKRITLAQKVMRGWLERKRLEKIRKRTEATKELLQTELGYTKCLDLMIHHYVKPLRINSTSTNAYILPSQVDDIFSTVEDIKQGSAMMLADLDSVMRSWNYFSCVGSVMLSHIDTLQPHMPFVVNYEKSQQVLAACSKNKEFSAFLKRRMTSAELDYKTLDDFLILPVQRIPRYIMLLEAIYKYTPASHSDREGVRKAAHQMRLLAEKINKRKASAAKVVEFASCLKGFEGELIQETRYLVREGHVTNEKKRPRYAALMNDLLVVCKPPGISKASKRDIAKKPTYKFVAQLRLDASTNLQVRPCTAVNGLTPYIIFLKNAHSSITITTGAEDGKGWTKDVHSVLEALRKKK